MWGRARVQPAPHTLCAGAKTPRIWPSAIVPWLQCSIRWDGARFAQPCVATIHETRSRAARAHSIIRCTPPAGAPQEKRAGKRAVGQILPQKGWKSANLNKLTQILHRLYDNSPRSLSRIFVFRCGPATFDFGTVVPQGQPFQREVRFWKRLDRSSLNGNCVQVRSGAVDALFVCEQGARCASAMYFSFARRRGRRRSRQSC